MAFYGGGGGPPYHNPYYPPGGPPPYNHYPAHLRPAYTPAPPTMPAAVHQQPNQATPNYNYSYSPQPVIEPVQVETQDFIEWYPSNPHAAPDLSNRAVVAGKEPGWDSSPLWVVRAYHNGDLVPGKLAVRDRRAYIPIGGREIPVHNFEVLCAPAANVRWIAANDGHIPDGAIRGGNTHTGEPLYVGRAKHSRSLTPGKIHPSHRCLYISFGGTEVAIKHYEVLCRVPYF